MNVFTMQQDNVMSSSSPVDPNWVFFGGLLVLNALIFVGLVCWRDWKYPRNISRIFWLTHPWQYYRRLFTYYKRVDEVGWYVIVHLLLDVAFPVVVFGLQFLGALSCSPASGSLAGCSSPDTTTFIVVLFCGGVLFLVTLGSRSFEEIYVDYPATRSNSSKDAEQDKNCCDRDFDEPAIMSVGNVGEPVPSEGHSEKKHKFQGCTKCNNRTDAPLVLGAGPVPGPVTGRTQNEP